MKENMPGQAIPPVLIEVTRGSRVESFHRGHIVTIDSQGNLRHHLGDPETQVCLRSLAKPFQTLPVIATGAADAFGFGPEELALFSGSLSGQDFQVELVKKVLARLKLNPDAIQCGAHQPLHRPSAQALAKNGIKPSSLHHTCAGKHAAMLTLCVHHGWPLDTYLEQDHPVQLLILGAVARMVGVPPPQVTAATDGCGAPVFYVPLKNIALGYARLAAAKPDSPAGKLMSAILAHPKHIAGDGRLETAAMEAMPGRIFAKSGSEGGYALSLMEDGLGVAFKIEDGATRAMNPTMIAILDQLGRPSPAETEALAAFRQPSILNHCKERVGQIQAIFKLIL